MNDERLLLSLLKHHLSPREREAFEGMLRGLRRWDLLTVKQRDWAERRLLEFEPTALGRTVLDEAKDLPSRDTVPAPVDMGCFAGDNEPDDRQALVLPDPKPSVK